MKAKEYFAKYASRLMADGVTVDEFDLHTEDGKMAAMKKIGDHIDAACNEMFKEFVNEITETLKIRHCKTNSACGAVISEMNTKWNAMIPMFMEQYKYCPIKRNAINRFWAKEIPGIEDYLRGGLNE